MWINIRNKIIPLETLSGISLQEDDLEFLFLVNPNIIVHTIKFKNKEEFHKAKKKLMEGLNCIELP